MKVLSSTGLLSVAFLIWYTAPLHGGAGVPKSNLVFSHSLHAEAGIECLDCHTTIPESKKASDRNIPDHDICGTCHEDAIENGECATCHADVEDIVPLPHPARKYRFSHKAHLSRGLDCGDCHRQAARETDPVQEKIPGMETCSTCHDGRRAPIDCGLCHLDPEGARKRSHPDGWVHSHKYEATQDDASCRTCHPNTDKCLGCHEGDNLRQTSHPLNYSFTHTLDAKGKEKDCTVCHSNPSFCNDCHRREEVMPLNHSSASWPSQGHASEARRDMESCAGCHDEDSPTCLRCHQDLDDIQGTDPSPHGPDFASEMGRGPWHDDLSYLCYRCHRADLTPREGGFCRYCHAIIPGGGGSTIRGGGPLDAF